MVERTETRSSTVPNVPKRDYVEGQQLFCCGGKYKGAIVKFRKQLRVKVRVQFNDGELRDLMPTSVQPYILPTAPNFPKTEYVEGQQLFCCGGKYKGGIVQFHKQLRVKVRVQLSNGEVRDLMPTSVEPYIPPVQKRVKTTALLAMVEMGLMMQELDTLDRDGFLIVCDEIGRQAFA
jgi:hypothetical protein